MNPHRVFITGATGHVGRWLIPALSEAGHKVHAPVRPGSEGKLTSGCEAITGDPLDAQGFVEKSRAAIRWCIWWESRIRIPRRRSSSAASI